MNTRIYVLTHKKFDVPSDLTYVPLQVGTSSNEDLNYLKDNTGENISHMNCYYSELTGLYWIWKNIHDVDLVGVCHYRRYLLNDKELVLTKSEIESLLKEYDILTSKCLDLNFSYYYGFGENHNRDDLDKTIEVLRELYPEFAELFVKRVHEKHTYFGNIMYCSKELFDSYCEFLFPIFEHLHGRIDLDSLDSYHRRLYGFISEFILYVWCEYKSLRVRKCKVGIIGEKKETRETKEKLFHLLQQGKVQEAKTFFLVQRQQRPDILMEASDISGELHLLLEVISICEFEISAYGAVQVPLGLNYKELIAWVNELNKACTQGNASNYMASEVAVSIATRLMNAKGESK